MNNTIINLFSTDTAALSLRDVLLNFIVALILSIMVYVSYSMSHSGAQYSAKFNKYLAMLVLITALVINVVGGGIGISLAALGIFSMLRVNQNENDTGNTAYILWSIAIGICCGVRQYTVAVIGSSVIFIFAAVLESAREYSKKKDSYILYILAENGSQESMQSIEDIVLNIDFDNLKLNTKWASSEGVEYIFELSENILNNDKSIKLENLLWSIDGVSEVKFIRQSEYNT